MSHSDHGQSGHPNRHSDKQQTPHRVAGRLEGVVKNRGTKKSSK